MDIAKLIGDNKTLQALQALIDSNIPDAILLKAQYENGMKQFNMGTIDHGEWMRVQARVNWAALELAKKVKEPIIETGSAPIVSVHALESWLRSVMVKNKRRNETLYTRANTLLDKYRAYQDQKSETPTYDPANRRFDGIIQEMRALKTEIEESAKDDLEKVVDRIQSLISDRVPTWGSLQEAYNLAVGRGMKNEKVERVLLAQPADEEAHIDVTEAIEDFLTTLAK